jgi:ribonuclease VapC
MIVDTSAIVALWLREPGWEDILKKLRADAAPKMSAVTLVELCAVLDSRSAPENRRRLDALLDALAVGIVPFDEHQARVARAAYRDFGKGSGHPAKLNLGDCCSYALASVSKQPLLFVGDDFSHTDISPA